MTKYKSINKKLQKPTLLGQYSPFFFLHYWRKLLLNEKYAYKNSSMSISFRIYLSYYKI